MPPPSQQAKKRQSSIMFAKGTKPDRSQTSNRNNAPAANNNRDSVAWGGLGNLANASDSDSSDDDDDRRTPAKSQPAASNPPSTSANQQQQRDAGVRQSWTSRAVAVGDRPPDSASQNPRSLKLLALKSAREGGQKYVGSSGAAPAASSAGPSSARSGGPIPTPTYDRAVPASMAVQQQATSSRPAEQTPSRAAPRPSQPPQSQSAAPTPAASAAVTPTARQIQIQQQRDEAARRAKQQIAESKEKTSRAEAAKVAPAPRPALPDAEKAQRIREQREEAARRVRQQYEEAKAKSSRSDPSSSTTAAAAAAAAAGPSSSSSAPRAPAPVQKDSIAAAPPAAPRKEIVDPLSVAASASASASTPPSASRVETRAPIQRGYVDRTSRHGSTINFASMAKAADPLGSDGFGGDGKVWQDSAKSASQPPSSGQQSAGSVPRILLPAPGPGPEARGDPPSPLTAVASQLQAGLQSANAPPTTADPPGPQTRGPPGPGPAGPGPRPAGSGPRPAGLGPNAQQPRPVQSPQTSQQPPAQRSAPPVGAGYGVRQPQQQWAASPPSGPQRMQGPGAPPPSVRVNGQLEVPAALQAGARPQDRSPPQNAVRNPSPLNPNRGPDAQPGPGGPRTAGSGPSPPQSALINTRGGPYDRNGSPTLRQGGPRPNGPPGPGGPPGPPGQGLGPGGPSRGSPSPQPRPGPSPGPSFSDSNPPYQAKQPSMFRRSLMLLGGGGGGGYEAARTGGGGEPPRQNAWRRSMAFMTGAPRPPPPPQPYREEEKPVRVQGFAGEKEQLRRSAYLGGGAAGDEWDYEGSGNNFWRRFSAAQRHAQNPNDGMEQTSRSYLRRIASGRRRAKCLTALAGVIIIAGIVGVVVWRSSQANSDSSVPGTIDTAPGGQIQVGSRAVLGEGVLPIARALEGAGGANGSMDEEPEARSSTHTLRQRTRRHHALRERALHHISP